MNARVPPNDLGAERALIGSVLLDNDILDVVATVVESHDFYSEVHQCVWNAVTTLAAAGSPVDTITLRDHLVRHRRLQSVGGDEYLLSLTDTIPNVTSAEAYAKLICGYARVRAVIAAAHEIASAGYGQLDDVEEFIHQAEGTIYSAATPRSDASLGEGLGELVHAVHREMLAAKDSGQKLMGITTGIPQLDELTTGYQPGELYIVGARPGMGKSAYLGGSVQRAAMAGEPCVVFSCEMPRKQWAQRALGSQARVDIKRIRTAQMNAQDWWSIEGAVADLSKLPIWIDDTPAISLMAVGSKLRRLRKHFGRIGLVGIDYLQLMRADGRAGNREQEISQISQGLKALAKQLEVPIVALAQLNRGLEARQDKRPMLSDLRESGAIEQDADTIMFIYRDEYYYPKKQETEGIAEFIVGKQRSGPCGTVKTRFFQEYTRFEALAYHEQEDMDL